MRINDHPILGKQKVVPQVMINVDGCYMQAREGESIAAALMAAGITTFRKTAKHGEPRGVFCAIGRCTDCMMTVDGIPNVRTCVTPVYTGMKIKSQKGVGKWE